MSYFQWNQEEFTVNVKEMDDMHQTLISKMNTLFEKNQNGAAHAELRELMDDLGAYTVKHFEDEEAYMEKVNFPGLSTHKLIHQDLLGQFTKHKGAFEAAGSNISDEFFAFLKVWLKSHICGIDKKYGEFNK